MEGGEPWLIVAAALAAVVAARAGLAAEGGVQIERVEITGNLRVEEDAIRVHLRAEPGQTLDEAALDADLRSVYAMGFFDQVTVEVQPVGDDRVVVLFRLEERPLVRNVTVEGADKVDREEVEGALKVRPYTILDPAKARDGASAAKRVYVEKGYLDAEVTYVTNPVGENEVDVVYTVKEHDRVRISDIVFEGNEAFSDRKLRSVMQTKEKSLLSIVTGSGVLNDDVLRTDTERLTAWYYDHGYIMARVAEPEVARTEDGLRVTVKVDEGEQFRVGTVSVEGESLPPDRAALVEGLDTTPGDVFQASALRQDVQTVTERLSEDGYAFATVDPDPRPDPANRTVDVIFKAERGQQVFIDRIEVTGNSKTRDYVIRREMRLHEQEMFSAIKLRKSREALQRLGFFQEVNITTRRTASGDGINAVVNVKEAQTGSFSAGAGFSSTDNLLLNVRIQENNLFGRGQRLILNADVGTLRRNILLSFTEPYFRETPLTLGVDVFSWRLSFDSFDRAGTGFGVNATYPVTALGYTSLFGLPLEEVRVGAAYRLEQASIEDLSQSATDSIRAEAGTSLVSSITPRLTRNTLNHALDPTAGSLQDLSVEVAGLGGDRFFKAELRERWYYTFLRSKRLGDFTYSFGAALGYGFGEGGLSGNDLPLFERYFPGGINSIRGFQARTMGPREFQKNTLGQIVSTDPIGGSQQIILNNEIIFPLVQSLGVKGVLFVDAGNAYGTEELQGEPEMLSLENTRFAAGGGVRWLSPLGPLRIEAAQAFNTKPFDETELIQFSFGGPFQF
jgi:outer membrane protein insertion porin family